MFDLGVCLVIFVWFCGCFIWWGFEFVEDGGGGVLVVLLMIM